MGRTYDFYEQRIVPHGLDLAMRPLGEMYRGSARRDGRAVSRPLDRPA